MRILVTISAIILFYTASCQVNNENSKQVENDFELLLLPADSTTFYFNLKPHWRDTTPDALDTFLNKWFSSMLYALREPVIKNYSGSKEIYRFTWLRTFHHPVVVRLEKQGEIIRLFSKVSEGAGGYHPGKIFFDTTVDLSQKHIEIINTKLDNANFWTLQTENIDNAGSDGSQWIIEVIKDNKYHLVVRWTPDRVTSFRKIGEYLLSISQIKNETANNGDY